MSSSSTTQDSRLDQIIERSSKVIHEFWGLKALRDVLSPVYRKLFHVIGIGKETTQERT